MSIFRTDLMAAMAFKGMNPETAIFVSLERARADHDAFWSNTRVLAEIAFQTIVLRLTESETPGDFAQFQQHFRVDAVPSLTVFPPNSPQISQHWDPYPSVDEFVAFLRPPRAAAAPPRAAARAQIKISLRGRSGAVTKEFPRTATVGDLRAWLAAELGPGGRVLVAPSQAPLPADDAMTLVQADLAPSAVLHAVGGDAADAEIVIDRPPERRAAAPPPRRPPCNCTGALFSKIRRYGAFALALLNPWAGDDDEEDFLQYSPNPQRQREIRLQARMMQRLQRQRAQAGEA
jgi:hypothetical protein